MNSKQGARRFSERLKKKADLEVVASLRWSARLKLIRQKQQDANGVKHNSRCPKLKNFTEERIPLRSSKRIKGENSVLKAQPTCPIKPKRTRADENDVALKNKTIQNVENGRRISQRIQLKNFTEERMLFLRSLNQRLCTKPKKQRDVGNVAPVKAKTQSCFGSQLKKKKKTVRFRRFVRVEQAAIYNRKIRQPKLRPRDLNAIKEWLNKFKKNEMIVHPASQHHTSLYKVSYYPRRM